MAPRIHIYVCAQIVAVVIIVVCVPRTAWKKSLNLVYSVN